MARDFPTGTVTFLFTDVEGSMRLWEEAHERANEALARHDEIIEGVVGRHSSVLAPRAWPRAVTLCVDEHP
jgi:class 3 adenylate cyclase